MRRWTRCWPCPSRSSSGTRSGTGVRLTYGAGAGHTRPSVGSLVELEQHVTNQLAQLVRTHRRECSLDIASGRRVRTLVDEAYSGDILGVWDPGVLRIGDLANIELVRQLIQAHAYWRLKGLAVDWWSLLKGEWIDTGKFGLKT